MLTLRERVSKSEAVRIGVTVDRRIHLKLKVAAAVERTTMNSLIEKLITDKYGNILIEQGVK